MLIHLVVVINFKIRVFSTYMIQVELKNLHFLLKTKNAAYTSFLFQNKLNFVAWFGVKFSSEIVNIMYKGNSKLASHIFRESTEENR